MKYLVSILFAIFFFTYSCFAAKLDFSFIPGLKKGMTKQQVLKLLDSDSLNYEFVNNGAGGKFLKITNYDSLLFKTKVQDIRMVFKKNIFDGISIILAIDNPGVFGILDKLCNCRIDGDEGNSDAFYFDDGAILFNSYEPNRITYTFALKHKCDE